MMNSRSADSFSHSGPVSRPLLAILVSLLFIGLIGVIVTTYLSNAQVQKELHFFQKNTQLRNHSLTLEKSIKEASEGKDLAFDQIERTRSQINTHITELRTKYRDLAEMAALIDSWDALQSNTNTLLKNKKSITQSNAALQPVVRQAVNQSSANAQLLNDHATLVYDKLKTAGVNPQLVKYLQYGLLLVLLIATLLLVMQINRMLSQLDTIAPKPSRGSEDRDQDAILRLLDEIGGLADGDLTAQATVTEDFTGAIADSINYAIDQLRGLVGTINTMAVKVSRSAQSTQTTAMQLAEASDQQAQEIAGASAAIKEMATSIDLVSADAAESAKVAEQSVLTANKGNQLVHNTITGMDNIREQIQDTSKRIKRLGESSQEIGDIVDLIHDIADQTNILALNAAIQASTAGDAGRGFAIVADEVQRLAERSSAATKQIETLVKAIQTDTNEAVISMEQTTTEVVRGARLAQDAGVSLEEIETVSKVLADLIQNISNTARQQASSAGHISNTMNIIQKITNQTSSGTTTTALSVGELVKMAVEMRNSIAGFTLPENYLNSD